MDIEIETNVEELPEIPEERSFPDMQLAQKAFELESIDQSNVRFAVSKLLKIVIGAADFFIVQGCEKGSL